MIYSYKEHYSTVKKNELLTNNIDKSQKHYKWKKVDSKECIPYNPRSINFQNKKNWSVKVKIRKLSAASWEWLEFGQKGTFWDDGSILYHDGSHASTYIYQTHPTVFLRPVHFTVCKFYLHWDSNQHCSSLQIPFPNKSIQKLPLHQKAGFHGALCLSSLKCTMCFSFISLKTPSFLWTWIAL